MPHGEPCNFIVWTPRDERVARSTEAGEVNTTAYHVVTCAGRGRAETRNLYIAGRCPHVLTLSNRQDTHRLALGHSFETTSLHLRSTITIDIMKFTVALFAVGALAAVRRQATGLAANIEAITSASKSGLSMTKPHISWQATNIA